MDRILQRSESEAVEDVGGETSVEEGLPSDGMEVDGQDECRSDEEEEGDGMDEGE